MEDMKKLREIEDMERAATKAASASRRQAAAAFEALVQCHMTDGDYAKAVQAAGRTELGKRLYAMTL